MKKLKRLLFFYLILFSGIIKCQNLIDVKIVTSENNEAIENAIVLNLQNNKFVYTDSFGLSSLNYKTELDSFKIIIPSFNEKTFIIKNIKQNHTVSLEPRITLLKEVIVKSRNEDYKKLKNYSVKSKKKYYTSHISNGGAIVSEFILNEDRNKKLQSISFFIKAEEGVEIRPLLYEISKEGWVPVIETPLTFFVNSESQELNMNIENLDIELKPRTRYVIGIALIDKNKTNRVEILSSLNKGLISYLKPKPNSNWFRIQPTNPNFSIYYSVYFKE